MYRRVLQQYTRECYIDVQETAGKIRIQAMTDCLVMYIYLGPYSAAITDMLTSYNSGSTVLHLLSDPHKLLVEIVGDINVGVYKELHWLVQAQPYKFLNLREVQQTIQTTVLSSHASAILVTCMLLAILIVCMLSTVLVTCLETYVISHCS